MTEDEGLTPITQELLKDDQLLTLTFPTSGTEIEAYSFLVKRSAPVAKTYTEMQSIPSGDTVSANKLGEDGHNSQVASPGDSVYRLDESTDPRKIYHFGQAWFPDDVQIYWENPSDQLANGWVRKVAIDESDDEGFILSQNTRYAEDIPSTALETIIIPGVTPFIGFQNAHPELDQTPTALFLGKAYDVAPVNAEDLGKAKDIALGKGYKRTLKSFGPLDAYSISIPDEWGDSVTVASTEFIDALGGG